MEKYIDRRLEETRRHVRAVDLTVVSLRLSIGVLVYLLAAMVLDHWVLAEGLGKGSRLLLWAGLVLVGGWYCARFLFPLLIHRINPIFAAQTIERTRPTFKNGLINFLLLRRDQEAVQTDELSKRVYRGLQVRTASELSRVTVGTTVDRLHVIRLGYLLATLVAICCLYFVVSPKNPLVSFGRVIFPWARIGAPTRVAIDAVEPGNTVAYQGDNLVVSAEIHGLQAGEPVSLYYSSVDGQSVDQSVPMSVPEGGFRYQGELPPGNLGFQQSLLYWIAAGDAASPTFRIDVQIPPAIVVERVEYEYPAYTGLPQRTAIREGDIRAVEGTRVTIHGSANFPIAQAFIELEGDSRPTVRMTAEGSAAVGRLTLAMSRSDPSQPEYHWYQLRFTDPERRENRRPIRHRIDVIADQKPEVRLVDPPPEELPLPVNGSVELKVHAEDPDFGLRRVELRAEREGRGLLIPPLLKKSRPDKPHQGPFEASYLFEPTRWSLKAGDKVTYWAEAADCKEKADDPSFVGNLAETERRTILIVAGDPQQKPSTKPQSKQDSRQKPKPGQPGNADEQPNDPMQKPDGQDQEQPGSAPDKSKPDKDAPPKGRQPQEKPSPDSGQPGQKQKQEDSSEDNNSGQGDQAGQKTGGEPDKGQGKAKSKSKPGESGEPSDTEEPSDSDGQQGDPSQAGKTGGKKDGSGGKAEQPSGPVDGDTNPAEAFERILEDQQQAKGQPGKQEKPSTSDSQPSGQEPQESQSAEGRSDSGNQSQDGMKSGAKPKKSDTERPTPDQKPAGEEKSDESPGGKEEKGDKPQGAQRPKPSAGAKGMEGQDAEGQDADSNAEDKGAKAKAKSSKKGDSGKTKSSDSQDMDQEGADGQKSDSPQKGAAGQKKSPSGAEKPAPGQSAEPGDEGEKSPAKTGDGKQEKKPAAGKRSKPSDGTEAGNEPEASEGKADSSAKKGGTGDRKAASKGEKGDANSKDDQTDSQAKTGEKTSAAERKGKQEQKGTSPESMGGADEKKTPKGGEQEKGPKGAEPQSRPESPGTGEPPSDKSTMPSPQGENQPGQKKQGETGTGKKDEQKGGGDEPSPSISPKTSKTKSDTEGDRSADGKTGGGQQAKQTGEGMPGSQTPSDQGNQGSEQQGEGEIGNKPGEKSMSDQATGKPGDQGEGKGTGSQKRPGGAEPGKQPQKNDPSQKNADAAKGAQPGTESSSGENSGQKGGSTSGNPTEGGGEPGKASQNAPPPAPPAPPPDDPNLEYSRKQTTLALEHLADQLAKDKSELLERLGWDKAYAENFLRQWEQMRQTANQPGPQGDAAKRELDKALKSLGLRPVKSEVHKAKSPTDKIQQLQGTGRIPPPLEWRDIYKAYNEGVGGSRE